MSGLAGSRIRERVGDTSWMEQANCQGLDPDLFFTERGESAKEAKEVCRGCTVRAECLEYALVNGEHHGIWGGLSERERRKIRKHRNAQRRIPPPAAPVAKIEEAIAHLEGKGRRDDPRQGCCDWPCDCPGGPPAGHVHLVHDIWGLARFIDVNMELEPGRLAVDVDGHAFGVPALVAT